MKYKSNIISLGKAVSWRFIGTLYTFILVKLITGQWTFALSVGFFEITIKVFLFYIHDRVWERLRHRKDTQNYINI